MMLGSSVGPLHLEKGKVLVARALITLLMLSHVVSGACFHSDSQLHRLQ